MDRGKRWDVLTDKFIRYIIRQLERGRDTKVVAEEMKVPQRHVQRLWRAGHWIGVVSADLTGMGRGPAQTFTRWSTAGAPVWASPP